MTAVPFSPLVLASASPRRRELLAQIGLSFEQRPVDVDETPHKDEAADLYVLRMAREKAVMCQRALAPGPVILGADTAVVLDGEILGKPRNRADARRMLDQLSGRVHRVMSGVALAGDEAVRERVVTTEVRFRLLCREEIEAYLETDEPWDKAGAYGIQGLGGAFVSAISGSYSAVVGLPLEAVADLLQQTGRPVWESWGTGP